jgi:hypothetical protein
MRRISAVAMNRRKSVDSLVFPCAPTNLLSAGKSHSQIQRSRRWSSVAAFLVRGVMDYEAFTNESLTMMYEGIRGALRADDAMQRDARDPPFRIRQTPEWKKHAARLEAEMLRPGMFFEVIDWT